MQHHSTINATASHCARSTVFIIKSSIRTIVSRISRRSTTMIDHSVFEQKFAALKTFRQFLADGLLDHARPGKADQRLRFGDDHVAEHRKARGHAAGRRVGQNGDKRQTRVVQHARARPRSFAICISDSVPSCIRAPPDAAKMTTAPRVLERAFDQPRDLFADRRAHRAADERHIHRAGVNQMAADLSLARNDRFGQARSFFRLLRCGLYKALYRQTRAGRADVTSSSSLSYSPSSKRIVEPLARRKPKMIIAMRANLRAIRSSSRL